MNWMLAVLSSVAMIVATGVGAQGWTVSTYSDLGYFGANVRQDAAGISFGCGGRYPSADPMLGEDSTGNRPYTFGVEVSVNILPYSIPDRRSDVLVAVGGQGFQFPMMLFSDLDGAWISDVSLGDPLVAALMTGSGGIQVWAGQTLLDQPTETTLAQSLYDAIQFCDSHWIAAGTPLPAHAVSVIQTLRGQVSTPAPAAITMEAAMLADVTANCGGAGQVSADAIGRSDFDGDGAEDILLAWNGVSCSTGPMVGSRGAGQCGMQNCLNTAYLSSQYQLGLDPWGMLALDAWTDPSNPGDILMSVAQNVCVQLQLQPDCVIRRRWNGVDFVQVPR